MMEKKAPSSAKEENANTMDALGVDSFSSSQIEGLWSPRRHYNLVNGELLLMILWENCWGNDEEEEEWKRRDGWEEEGKILLPATGMDKLAKYKIGKYI
jgi:hypothetical protein